jgi:hypothetical protein
MGYYYGDQRKKDLVGRKRSTHWVEDNEHTVLFEKCGGDYVRDLDVDGRIMLQIKLKRAYSAVSV